VIARDWALLLLATFLVWSAHAQEHDAVLQGTVNGVYDGDTLDIEPHGKVRLIGIDTPEKDHSYRDRYLEKQGISASRQREIYQAAKHFNIRHVKGQPVTLVTGQPQRDRHGRLLAYVYLADGRLLNSMLLDQGLAVVYRKFTFRLKEDFLAVEKQARQAKVGLWANP